MDQSKKTMRHFYCRDVLWETFEQMANDFDCSIDYLVNEAMRYYARSKNYQSPSMSSQQVAPMRPTGSAAQSGALHFPRKTPIASRVPGEYGTPIPGPRAIGEVAPPRPTGSGGGAAPFRSLSPTPTNRPADSGPAAAASPSPLYLVFNNQRVVIDKDQFIIGRGSKTSDLAIKDGNISRKHAAVVRLNGVYYIKDLGSTNGIDYKGMRINNKRIDEGDVFHLCDHELRFTYRG